MFGRFQTSVTSCTGEAGQPESGLLFCLSFTVQTQLADLFTLSIFLFLFSCVSFQMNTKTIHVNRPLEQHYGSAQKTRWLLFGYGGGSSER